MSSSSARAFLVALAAAAAIASAAVLALTALVDPGGLVATLWPGKPQLCTPGLRSGFGSRAAVAARMLPDELLVGNSRVQRGFGLGDVRLLLGERSANLAVPAAVYEDVDLLVRRAMRDASPRRVWIGVDFAMFFNEEGVRGDVAATAAALDGKGGGKLALVRQGLANGGSVQAALGAISSPRACARPEFDAAGFVDPAQADYYAATKNPARFQMVAVAQEKAQRRVAALGRRKVDALYRKRMRMLERLAVDLRRQGADLVLFEAPVHPRLRRVMVEQGLIPYHERWKRDMDALAAGAGLAIVELPPGQVHKRGEPDACARESRPAACPFYDPTHYKPWVGRLILERALAGAAARRE